MKDREKVRTKLGIISYFLVTALFFAVFFTPIGFASSSEKGKLDEINNRIDDTQNALNEGKKKASVLQSEIKDLEKKIYSTEVEINNLQKNINSTKTLISKTLGELNKMEKEIAVQNEGLNSR